MGRAKVHLSRLVPLLLVVISLQALGGSSNRAWALACDQEQTKFVEWNTTSTSYGSMGSILPANRTIDPCGVLANTVHLHLGYVQGQFDFAEIGIYQVHGDSGWWYIFDEWSMWPYFHNPQLSGGTFEPNAWVSFNVSNVTGTQPTFKFQWGWTQNPSGWTTFDDYTASGYYSHGDPESEVSRHGNTDGYIKAASLKYRPSTGGWFNWNHMRCSLAYGNTIPDWDALEDTSSSWHTVREAPPPGDC